MPMPAQRVDESLFSEFLARLVECFRHPIRINCQRIPLTQRSFLCRAVPLAEQSQYRARRHQMLQSAVVPEEKRGQVATICISQSALPIVVVSKEQSGISALGGVFVKYLIDGSQ